MLCDHIDHIDHSLAGSPTFHVDGKTSSSFLRHSGLTRNLGSFIPVILYLQREDINDSSFANAKGGNVDIKRKCVGKGSQAFSMNFKSNI